ncbi:MAG TPA: polysaccharide lyase 6 family protein [Opitutaceae bacterium]|nr:polysaccharide lyase 6 family protein [Opitutaceae bacterium]
MHHPYSRWVRKAVVVGAWILLATLVSAETYVVDSLSGLQAKIESAEPGDTLVVKNGAYTAGAALTIIRRGVEGRPLTIMAETVGGVEIQGSQGFALGSPASHVVISGFVFTHAAGKFVVGAGTRHIRITRNVFRMNGGGAYLSVLGHDVQIDRNEFADKATAGSMLAISGPTGQVAQRLWIHRNYFHDYAGSPGEAGEMLRYGLSTQSLSLAMGVVEHNLFARCRGGNELVSNRVSSVVYRYNTFQESPSASLTLRHGNDSLFYSNTVSGTEGLRVFGDRHQIYSNVFVGNYIGVAMGNGSTEVAEGGPLNGHDRPDRCAVIFNTFLDNRTHYQMSRRTPTALGAQQIVFANNLLQGGGIAAKIEGPYKDAIWENNLHWQVGAVGDFPLDAFTVAETRLAGIETANIQLSEGSVAFDAAAGVYPQAGVDRDGQPRIDPKDIGADEVSDAPRLSRVLTPLDVGPEAR